MTEAKLKEIIFKQSMRIKDLNDNVKDQAKEILELQKEYHELKVLLDKVTKKK